MIYTRVVRPDLTDLTDEITEQAKPILVQLMAGAQDIAYASVIWTLSKRRSGPAPEGEPPGMITGELLRSIRKEKPKTRGYHVIGNLFTSHPGAAVLNYGGIVLTKVQKAGLRVSQRGRTVASARFLKKQLKDAGTPGSHVRKPHPFIEPAMKAAESKIASFVQRELAP